MKKKTIQIRRRKAEEQIKTVGASKYALKQKSNQNKNNHGKEKNN